MVTENIMDETWEELQGFREKLNKNDRIRKRSPYYEGYPT